jgi:multidrug efflux pump subunit AcrA (membrane-fusion protein)
MFATATIDIEGIERVVVPSDAVISSEAEQLVYVVDEENIAHETPVTTGRTLDGRTEILDGLNGGERVVTEGAFGLPDGAEVLATP